MTAQGIPASEASLPSRLHLVRPPWVSARHSLPVLRQILICTGLGLLLTAAAVGATPVSCLAIGQSGLEIREIKFVTCTIGHQHSHGNGRDTTQYITPHWPAFPVRYDESSSCLRNVPLGAAMCSEEKLSPSADGCAASQLERRLSNLCPLHIQPLKRQDQVISGLS